MQAEAAEPPQHDASRLWTRVIDALQRQGQRRPKRLSALRRHAASTIGATPDAPQVQAVLDQLIARGAIAVDDAGAVSYLD